MLLAAFPFLPLRLKVEIKRVYEIADHAFALPPTFCQTVNPISTKGAWTPNLMFLKMKAHLKNAVGCIHFLAMEAKSRNQKDI